LTRSEKLWKRGCEKGLGKGYGTRGAICGHDCHWNCHWISTEKMIECFKINVSLNLRNQLIFVIIGFAIQLESTHLSPYIARNPMAWRLRALVLRQPSRKPMDPMYDFFVMNLMIPVYDHQLSGASNHVFVCLQGPNLGFSSVSRIPLSLKRFVSYHLGAKSWGPTFPGGLRLGFVFICLSFPSIDVLGFTQIVLITWISLGNRLSVAMNRATNPSSFWTRVLHQRSDQRKTPVLFLDIGWLCHKHWLMIAIVVSYELTLCLAIVS